MPHRGTRIAIAAALAVATALTFRAVVGLPFIGYDDPEYVTQNPHVLGGLTAPSFAWAWTASHASNWHPLTWLSHMLDVDLFGTGPAGPHAVNLLLHVTSVVLLFLIFSEATGERWRSALLAALFAVHPLRVESVAWVSERKDVLSACLWLGTTLAYVHWIRRRTRLRYAVVLVLVALGLGAKPMLVTLPFALLLLDVWPLRRLALEGSWLRDAWPLIREKTALFALSAGVCVVTLLAQRGAMRPMEHTTLGERIPNAIVAIVAYVAKAAWPSRLAVFYPFPEPPRPLATVVLAAAAIVSTTAVVWRLRERRPYLVVGWAWFMGTLVPVLGLVQVGNQAMADRYSYLPSIGLFLCAAWLVPSPRGRARVAAGAIALAMIVTLAGLTMRQIGYWSSDRLLFQHALEVTERNWMAETVIGMDLERQGEVAGATDRYRRALAINPSAPQALNNLGNALVSQGRLGEGIPYLRAAVETWPGYVAALANLGSALSEAGASAEAIPYLTEALRRVPDGTAIRFNLALALEQAGRYPEALAQFEAVSRADPSDAEARAGALRVRAKITRP